MKTVGDAVVYVGEIVEVRSVDTVSGRYLLACRDGARWVRFDEVRRPGARAAGCVADAIGGRLPVCSRWIRYEPPERRKHA